MANSLGHSVSMEVISKIFLENFYEQTIPMNIFAKNFSDEIANFGASITTHVNNVRTATTRVSATADYVDNDTTLTPVQVSLNQDIYDQAYFTAQDLSMSPVDLERTVIAPAAASMAKALQVAAFANITQANYPTNFVSTAGNFNFSKVSSLRTTCSNLNWGAERYLVISPGHTETLTNDTKINGLLAKTAELAIVDGYVGRVAGFEVFESTSLPVSGAYSAFACVPTAMAIAARAMAQPTDSYGSFTNLKSENGIPVQQWKYTTPSNNVSRVRWNTLFGSAKANSNGLVRITIS